MDRFSISCITDSNSDIIAVSSNIGNSVIGPELINNGKPKVSHIRKTGLAPWIFDFISGKDVQLTHF